ncbi:hypothetical protein J1614_011851 [Plenodomus biglobosus]|nr:hypothetical protein J1614_011851 [Plenodomus biglobosus]
MNLERWAFSSRTPQFSFRAGVDKIIVRTGGLIYGVKCAMRSSWNSNILLSWKFTVTAVHARREHTYNILWLVAYFQALCVWLDDDWDEGLMMFGKGRLALGSGKWDGRVSPERSRRPEEPGFSDGQGMVAVWQRVSTFHGLQGQVGEAACASNEPPTGLLRTGPW